MRDAAQLSEKFPTLVEGGLIRTEKWANHWHVIAKNPHSWSAIGDDVYRARVAGVCPGPERRSKRSGRSERGPTNFDLGNRSRVFRGMCTIGDCHESTVPLLYVKEQGQRSLLRFAYAGQSLVMEPSRRSPTDAKSSTTAPRSTSIETHISTLFFTEDRVFKLLKRVANGFLDHTDSAVRCAAASREVELNARIAPDIYLGTADVVEHGEIADRMIVMRRLPADRSVTRLLSAGALTSEHIRAIARKVATFHASLPRESFEGRAADAHRERWTDNTTELAPFVGRVISEADTNRVTELFTTWLDSHSELLDQRIADGYLRDGHGDLLADDIFCMDDGPQILDCLAFRDDLRLVDVLDDVAFLAMDLHRLGGPAWAQMFLRFYGEYSGEHHPGSLAHYYVAYRAHVRCKIACLRVDSLEHEFVAVAQMYHRLCLDHLERARLRLILVGGGPGSGKTTLATSLGDQLGCPVLSSDGIRKDLAKVERTVHELAQPDAGIYTAECTERTYSEMIRQAELLLGAGETVILDASWTSENHRLLARALANERNAQLTSLDCCIPDAVAKERIVRRMADPTSTSDATPEIVDHLAARRAPWNDAISIDTNQSFQGTEADALAALDRAVSRDASRT